MKCAVHSDADAVAYCRNCGKPLCAACARPVRDVIYCEDCLAATLGLPSHPPPTGAVPGISPEQPVFSSGTAQPAYPPFPPGAPGIQVAAAVPNAPNPGVAFALGFFPGLGAFYNEQYSKGMIHLAIFILLFITGVNGLDNDGATAVLWICIAGLWVYMPIDALRTAKARRAGLPLSDPLESWSKERPIGPIVLIGLGVLFLLNNFSWFAFYRVKQFWPLILIGAGLLMFRNRLGKDF